jgi:DNA-binding MarR family transcriptional regulator
VTLTAHGRETAVRGAAVVAGLEARAFADLADDEAEVLAALLERIIGRMAPGDRA